MAVRRRAGLPLVDLLGRRDDAVDACFVGGYAKADADSSAAALEAEMGGFVLPCYDSFSGESSRAKAFRASEYLLMAFIAQRKEARRPGARPDAA